MTVFSTGVFGTLRSLFAARRRTREEQALTALKARYHAFRIFLENNGRALELLVNADNALAHGETDLLRSTTEHLLSVTGELVDGLNLLSGEAHTGLYALHGTMSASVRAALDAMLHDAATPHYCITLDALDTPLYPLAGNKAARLAQLKRLHLPVPDGFVCTTHCCRDMLSAGDLTAQIRHLLREVEEGTRDATATADAIHDAIMRTPLPEPLANAMDAAFSALAQEHQHNVAEYPFAISVRSSGVAEDRTDHSFAGQFTSILNVMDTHGLHDAYKQVLASGFSARAITYRLHAGLSPADFDLAVLCQRMVPARCAGVMMTRSPAQPNSGRLLISAAPGLGTLAVGGSAPVDLYTPWRTDSDAVSHGSTPQADSQQPQGPPVTASSDNRQNRFMNGADIPRKTVREVASSGGGLVTESVPEDEAHAPLLDIPTLERLVMYGEMIESIEGMAQDVEWAVDYAGTIHLLQARPLRLITPTGMTLPSPASAPPLATGICASGGKAVGRVCHARNTAELLALSCEPATSPRVLVLPQALVDAARHLKEYTGVVIDSGNPTDHLSCIAREYGIPLVTAVRTAGTVLHTGQWVVVDADNGLIQPASEQLWNAYDHDQPAHHPAGSSMEQEEVSRHSAPSDANESCAIPAEATPPRHTPLHNTVHELLIPLNLTEAYGPTFSWQECRSVHDLVRYTHEMAVLAMFHAGDSVMEEAGGLLRPLDLGIPFHFLVIDLGGATRRHTHSGTGSMLRRALRNPLHRDDILSAPLAALCDGLLTPDLSWHSGPDPEAVSGIVSRTMLDSRGPRPAGSFNYALAARDYLNLNARVEFHFAMLDAVCGGDAQANYIRFRFKGGGAGAQRGHRRAIFLRYILEHHGFVTTVVGDLVTASLTGASRSVVHDTLVMLGRLLGFSRFLDGAMRTDETPLHLAEAFLQGRYDTRN